MPKIKNIIFDQGGILLNIDYALTAQAFRTLGATDFDEVYSQKTQCAVFDLYDTGKISSAEFRKTLKETLKIQHVSDVDFDKAWNAMLLDLPIARLEFISTLRPQYQVFILSNANEIHMIEASKTFQRTTGSPSLAQYFDGVYYSHECGLRKPNAAFFEMVLKKHALSPEETLFIDDSRQHVLGAQSVGMQTMHLPHGCIIEELPGLLRQNTLSAAPQLTVRPV